MNKVLNSDERTETANNEYRVQTFGDLVATHARCRHGVIVAAGADDHACSWTMLLANAQAGSRQPATSENVIKLYVIEYDDGRNRYHTVVEARDIEAAKRQFRRDNHDVEMLSCV